jgi:alpha-glucosidase
MLKNLGLSGFSMAGADVGGYAGTPTAELLTKWIEIAAFQPLDRDHAEKGTGDHEVWANGPAQEDIRRRFIETRYRLLPYLYTVIEEGTHTGLPLLRPLFLEFPDAAPDRHPLDVDLNTSGEFMVGPDLLVAAPAFADKTGDDDATLPSTGWYDFWTGKVVGEDQARVLAGGLQPETSAGPVLPAVRVHRELATLPVFVRPGAMLPIEPLVQSTDDRPVGPLTLRVFPGPNCGGHLYQDDGKSFAYQHGRFLRMSFTCEASADHRQIRIRIGRHEGSYPAWWKQIALDVNGLPRRPSSVSVEGQAARYVYGDHAAVIMVTDRGAGMDIVVQSAAR